MNRNFPKLLYSGEAEETPSIKAQASNLSEAPDHTGPPAKEHPILINLVGSRLLAVCVQVTQHGYGQRLTRSSARNGCRAVQVPKLGHKQT